MNPIKILLVDDSKSARYALSLQLKRHDAAVETADSAEAALKQIKESTPDAIFMDHTMPGMDGFEALDILKASPETSQIPVVMCTSNEDPEFMAQARQKGALDILSKSNAQQKLPQMITRIRACISAASPAPAPEAPTTRNISETVSRVAREEVARLFKEHQDAAPSISETVADVARKEVGQLVNKQLDANLEQHIQAAIMPIFSEFAERLSGDVLAQTEQKLREQLTKSVLERAEGLLGERFESEAKRLEKRFSSVQEEQAKLSANRLLSDVLPQAVTQQLDQERNRLAQMVQELIDHSLDGLAEEPAFMGKVLEMTEATAASAAEQAARRHARGIEDAVGTDQASAMTDKLLEATRRSVRTMYALAAGAALVGVAASGLVFLLLS